MKITIGQEVKKLRPFDGSKLAGQPIGKPLRVVQITMVLDREVYLLSDKSWVFEGEVLTMSDIINNPHLVSSTEKEKPPGIIVHCPMCKYPFRFTDKAYAASIGPEQTCVCGHTFTLRENTL